MPAAADGQGAARKPSARSEAYRADDAPQKRKGGASNIGTEYGENQNSGAVEVAFERGSPTHPAAVLRLRYDDYAGLAARGIDLSSLGYAYEAADASFENCELPAALSACTR